MPAAPAPPYRPTRWRRRALPLAAALLIAAALAAWWTQRHAAAATAPRAERRTPVSVVAVQQRDLPVTVTALGTIAAANTAVVHARVGGPLQAIRFTEGAPVQAGQVLAQIDPEPFRIALAQAEAQLQRDQAQLVNARADLQRYRDLVAQDAAPQQQLDTQDALVHQLQATVAADAAARDNARLQLSYTTITAPIGGRAGLKQVDLGNVVNPTDANGVVTIAQTRPAAVVFAVPDAQLATLRARQAAHQPLPVQAWDRATHKLLAQGEVASIDNTIDPTTGTVKVKALFPNGDDALFPNQSVSVRLQLDTIAQGLVVPGAAVQRGAPGPFVFVLREDGRAGVRPVKVLASDGDLAAVQGELAPGERVIVDGTDRLREGAGVEVVDPAHDAAAAASAPAGAASGAGRRHRQRESAAS